MSRQSPKQSFLILAIILVIVLAIILSWLTSWDLLWIWLAAVNLITFLAYGYDKRMAQSGGMRVPEIILHGLALSGGFVGGWIGRGYFHHKTRKSIFAVILSISTVLWAAILFITLI